MNRAIVIKTSGDPDIAGAIADGINAVQLRAVQSEYNKLLARDGVRSEGDRIRWERQRKRLARKYRVEPVGPVKGAILGVWALLWTGIYSAWDRLDTWNRG